MAKKKAPIVVSVYDRPIHFKTCIDSLEKNKEAKDTELFISSDGPKDERSRVKVEEVREYIKSIRGFKKIFLFSEKENSLGRIKIAAKEAVKDYSDRYIITEDDNVFSRHALSYFNTGLEMYKNFPDVFAICGYMYPRFPDKPGCQVFLSNLNPWGIGYWSEKDIPLSTDQEAVAKAVLQDEILFRKINHSMPHVIKLSTAIIEHKLRAGDVIRCCHMAKHDLVCVFPTSSLVKNIGHDGTGQNCKKNNRFTAKKLLDKPIKFRLDLDRRPNPDHEKWIFNFFGGKTRALDNILHVRSKYSKKKAHRIVFKCLYYILHIPLAIMLRIK